MRTLTRSMQYRMLARSCRLLAASLLLITAAAMATAQQHPGVAAQTAATREQASTPARTAGEKPQAMNSQQALYLVRSTLLTLNDANRSGNYTVLRDLAAPEFQAKISPADLAQSFSDLRRRNFDLFATAILAPQFAEAPALDSNGRVRLRGSFATRPLQISFDLIFQAVGGQWRLLAISVATPEAARAQSQSEPPLARSQPKFVHGVQLFSATAGLRW